MGMWTRLSIWSSCGRPYQHIVAAISSTLPVRLFIRCWNIASRICYHSGGVLMLDIDVGWMSLGLHSGAVVSGSWDSLWSPPWPWLGFNGYGDDWMIWSCSVSLGHLLVPRCFHFTVSVWLGSKCGELISWKDSTLWWYCHQCYC